MTTAAIPGGSVEARPQWVEDSDAPSCAGCSARFTPFRRRHHCRACGMVFCGQCTQFKCPLPSLGYYAAVRVCLPCKRRFDRARMSRTMPEPASPVRRVVSVRLDGDIEGVGAASASNPPPDDKPGDASKRQRHRSDRGVASGDAALWAYLDHLALEDRTAWEAVRGAVGTLHAPAATAVVPWPVDVRSPAYLHGLK